MLHTIMLIDDCDMALTLTQIVARRAGIAEQKLSFDSATEALNFLYRSEAAQVDAILLDINMPVMNGFAFLGA